MLHQEPTTVSSNIILVSFPSLFTQHQSAQHGAWDTALCIVKCAMCYPRCHADCRVYDIYFEEDRRFCRFSVCVMC